MAQYQKILFYLSFYPDYFMMVGENLGLGPDNVILDTWLCIPSVR